MGMTSNEARQINDRFQKLDGELTALRFLFCQNLAMQYVAAGVTKEAMEENHEALRALFAKLAFGKMDPASSDAWADAIQQAMGDLLAQIEKSYQHRLIE